MLHRGEPTLGALFNWRIEIYVGEKRIRQKFEATEPDAHAIYSDYVAQQSRAHLGLTHTARPIAPLLTDAVARYLQDIQNQGQNARHRDDVAMHLTMLGSLLHKNARVDALKRDHMLAFLEKRKEPRQKRNPPQVIKAKTINKARAHVQSFCQFCVYQNWLETNPMATVAKRKETAPPPRMLAWADFEKFADAAWKDSAEFGLLVEVLAESGARIGEIIRATVADVNVERRAITRVLKGGRRVSVDAGPWVIAAALNNQADASSIVHVDTANNAKNSAQHSAPFATSTATARADNDGDPRLLGGGSANPLRSAHVGVLRALAPLCPPKHGGQWSKIVIRRTFKRVSKAAGIARITPHFLRHGRTCWDIIDGLRMTQVQGKLGHTSVTTTEKYAKFAEELARAEKPGTVHARTVGM